MSVMYAFRATERGIQARAVPGISEEQPRQPLQMRSTWTVDTTPIALQRAEGLRQLRRQGMPEWARDILAAVADRHAICPSDIAGKKRNRPIIDARAEAAYLIKAAKPMLSSVILGKWFDKDHTSIAHLIARHQEQHGLPKLVGYNVSHVRIRMRNYWRAA
ncbi:MAG: hypothetical protein E5Y67_12435 [Mesorhizobium sp.]|uniref:helix-turn-helix domain-containing protein n=1 Tax=Mesorhizobium sp. TaxID=1871066 RepID=UPI001212DD22|nr:helix-turn-helix domain-containing protein [Mesorhizobium sp.]TIM14480.1 MAG: hypothetical protein E5Y67_12435 [Mesorhizobium sp.]